MRPRHVATAALWAAAATAIVVTGAPAYAAWRSRWAPVLVLVYAVVVVGVACWLLTRRNRRRAARDVDAWIREADGQPYDKEALRIALEEPDAPDADRWRQEEAPPTAEAWARFRTLLDERLRRRP